MSWRVDTRFYPRSPAKPDNSSNHPRATDNTARTVAVTPQLSGTYIALDITVGRGHAVTLGGHPVPVPARRLPTSLGGRVPEHSILANTPGTERGGPGFPSGITELVPRRVTRPAEAARMCCHRWMGDCGV